MAAAVGKAFALQLLSTLEGGGGKEEEKEKLGKGEGGKNREGEKIQTYKIANTLFQRTFMQSLKTIIRLQAVRPVKTWQG